MRIWIKQKNWPSILLFAFFYTYCYLRLLNSNVCAAETLSFIHSDHLGSTSLVTDSEGNVVSQQVYYPYGSTRSKLSADGLQPTVREYTGQVSDQAETDLYYYNARYYNPAIAKFTQADTVQGLNRYSYTANNPINLIDPTGNMDDAWDGGGGSTGYPIFQQTNQADITQNWLVQNWLSLGAPMLGNTESTQGFNFSQEEDRQAAKPLAIASAAVPALYMGFGAAVVYGPGIVSTVSTAATAFQQAIKMKILERFGNPELAPAVRMFQKGEYEKSLEEAERAARATYRFFNGFKYVSADQLPPGVIGGWHRMFESIRFLKNLSTSKIPAIHEVSHMIDDVLLRAGRQNTFTAEGQLGGYSYTTKEYLRSIISTELKAYLGCWASGRLSFAQTVKYFWQTSLNGTEGLSTLQVLLKAS